MARSTTKSVAIIVAHPDDETLWAGGTILSHPSWKCFIVCLCRGSDTDRAPKFHETLKVLQAEGIMGDLDDEPGQTPLNEEELENTIMQLLPSTTFDIVITHNSTGEYTKHLRHEETSKAVVSLWHSGKIIAKELWTFAYEDGNKKYLPRAIQRACTYMTLPEAIWEKKYSIITEIYGYAKNSWEARTTPMSEAFWQFKDSQEAKKPVKQFENEIKLSRIMILRNLIRKW